MLIPSREHLALGSFWICLRKAWAAKSHDYRDVIVFEKFRFQDIFRLVFQIRPV